MSLFFLPPILDSTETFSCDFLENCPRGEEKACTIFISLFFWGAGVHLTAFGVLEHVMNAVSVCIAETHKISVVFYSRFVE